MTPLVLLLPDPPLDPSGSEARSRLRRELLRPEYHDRNLIQQVIDWVNRKVSSGLDQASQAPQLSTLMAMVIFVALALVLGWLVSRARRTARDREEKKAVLTDEVITADELRARALVSIQPSAPTRSTSTTIAANVESGGAPLAASRPSLTRRQFWRTFGIALLTVLIAQVAGGMLSLPVSLASQLLLAASPGDGTTGGSRNRVTGR